MKSNFLRNFRLPNPWGNAPFQWNQGFKFWASYSLAKWQWCPKFQAIIPLDGRIFPEFGGSNLFSKNLGLVIQNYSKRLLKRNMLIIEVDIL